MTTLTGLRRTTILIIFFGLLFSGGLEILSNHPAIRKVTPLSDHLLASIVKTPARSGFPISGEYNTRPISILIVGGGTSHDFDRWYKQADAETLEDGGFATVIYTDNPDSIAAYLPQTDVLYLVTNQPMPDPAVRQAIIDFVEAGKGVVLSHAALWYNWNDWPEYNRQVVSGGSQGHDPYGEFQVKITNNQHPVTRGVEGFTVQDELYYFQPDPVGPGIEVLASANAGDANLSFPSVFVVKGKPGRVVGLALGHDAASHHLPAYQTLLRNAVQWVAHP